jgi:hypothetical protein
VVLLLLVGGAYLAMSGVLGGGSGTSPQNLSALNPPPSTPPTTPTSVPADTATPPPPNQEAPTAKSTPSATSTRTPAQGDGPAPGTNKSVPLSPPAQTTPTRTAATNSTAAPTPPAQAANPAVAFRCAGAANVCASLRSAIGPAFDAQSLVNVQDAAKADILVQARVEVVSERTEQMFGTTFVTRTYSVELTGEASASSQAVPMPSPTTFSFDARVGQERLDAQMRLVAASAAERVRAYWKAK